MEEGESAGHVEHELPYLGLRHLTNITTGRAILAIGHHEVWAVLVDIEMADVEKVGMMQLIGQFELIAEFCETFLVESPIELDGHLDISQ